jgi:hypothetical protein
MRGLDVPSFPRTPFLVAASILRCAPETFLSTKPNTSCKIEMQRRYAPRVFGFISECVRFPFVNSVRLRRNPQPARGNAVNKNNRLARGNKAAYSVFVLLLPVPPLGSHPDSCEIAIQLDRPSLQPGVSLGKVPMSISKLAHAVSGHTSAGCPEWKNILDSYPLATEAYNQAVMNLTSLDASGFNEAWSKAERARKVCENYRELLVHHRREHGCLSRSGTLSLETGVLSLQPSR